MTFYKTEKTLYKRDQEIPVDLNINQNTEISTMYISFCDGFDDFIFILLSDLSALLAVIDGDT